MIKFHPGKLGFFAAILGVCAGFTATSAQAVSVLVNGTFDDQSGWTGTFVNQTGGGGFPTIDTGPYYFSGSAADNAITQTYILNAADLLSLGSTGLDFVMSADLFGFDNQSDFSMFTADFRDTGNASLGTVMLSSATNAPAVWGSNITAGAAPNFQQFAGSLNSLTRSILFTVSSVNSSFTNTNDGYLDNAFFELNPGSVSTVPVPAAMPLLAGGLGLMGILGWRRKRRAPTA